MGNADRIAELNRWLDELARKWERFTAHDPLLPTPPERERGALERRLLALSREEARGAAEHFRMQQLLYRFTTYNNLWQRQLRDREEARRARMATERMANVPAPATVPPKTAGCEALHSEYLAALKNSGKAGSLSLERFRQALDTQRQAIEAKGAVVEGFEVVQEGSQVKLRALLRRGRQ